MVTKVEFLDFTQNALVGATRILTRMKMNPDDVFDLSEERANAVMVLTMLGAIETVTKTTFRVVDPNEDFEEEAHNE